VAEPKLDAAENLLTELVDKAELVAMVERGEIVHGVHIAAILLAARQSYW
jgi:hypothetical protein